MKIDAYRLLGVASNTAVIGLGLLFILAVVDHFLFEEEHRYIIKPFVIACLFAFFASVVLVIVKGIIDKQKK